MAKTTPVACTLTPAELAAQGERWRRLLAWAVTGRAETADASWTVERDAGTIVLDVRSTAVGVATLAGMFAPASAW